MRNNPNHTTFRRSLCTPFPPPDSHPYTGSLHFPNRSPQRFEPIQGHRLLTTHDGLTANSLGYQPVYTLALPQLFYLPPPPSTHSTPSIFPLNFHFPPEICDTWTELPQSLTPRQIYTDGSFRPSTGNLASSYIVSTTNDHLPWRERDICVHTITAQHQHHSNPYDAELLAATAVAHLPGTAAIEIITDCESLCTAAQASQKSFFLTHLLTDQPMAHMIDTKRNGTSKGILQQALHPHLPRLKFTHQKSHTERSTPNPLTWTVHQMGNYLADRAAAQDWDNITPHVHSITVCATQALPDFLVGGPHGPLPFTIIPNNSTEYCLPSCSSSTTTANRRAQMASAYLGKRTILLIDYSWQVTHSAIKHAFPKPSSTPLFATKLHFNKLHNAAKEAQYHNLPPPGCPFLTCSQTDSISHLLQSCTGSPDSRIALIRIQTTRDLYDKATSLQANTPHQASILLELTNYLTLPNYATIRSLPQASATTWAGLFPLALFQHIADISLPRTLTHQDYCKAVRAFVEITLPNASLIWKAYCTHRHSPEGLACTPSACPTSQNSQSTYLSALTLHLATPATPSQPTSTQRFSQQSRITPFLQPPQPDSASRRKWTAPPDQHPIFQCLTPQEARQADRWRCRPSDIIS